MSLFFLFQVLISLARHVLNIEITCVHTYNFLNRLMYIVTCIHLSSLYPRVISIQ